MATTRFRRVEELFERARALPANEQRAFAEREGGGDERLRRDLLSLLEASSAAAEFLEIPADPRLGCTIGKWRLTRRLGAGGMGIVYAAARSDGTFEQEVALKLLRSSIDSAEGLARFHRERQLLARLQHEGIARLLDGGTTDDGTPYLVMERVDGLRIDEFCDAAKLPIERRLDLFLQVCDAVHFAHRHFVVHRDLKPSNLLVAGDAAKPAVKLLDFGIAKAIGDDSARTLTIERRLTPEYASPEVVRGQPVTTATDVYSLGVILFELITGARPYSTPTDTPAALERAICDTLPPLPSRVDATASALATRATTAERLREQLRGDLDSIVGKALAKEPERRYTTVLELAADLRRWLAREPVEARPVGRAYRMRLWVRRNRTLAAALIAGSITFFAGTITTALGWIRASEESAATARESQVTARLNELLHGFLVALKPGGPGDDLPALEVSLRTFSQRLDQGLLKDRPAYEATIRGTLADLFAGCADHDGATRERRRAHELLARIHGAMSDPADRELLLIAAALHAASRFEESARVCQDAIARRDAAAAGPLLTALLLERLAYEWIAIGDGPAAVTTMERCLVTRAAIAPPGDGRVLTAAKSALGEAWLVAGDNAKAEALLREALAERRQVFKAPHRQLSIAQNLLGLALLRLGRIDEAEAELVAALAMRRELYDADNPFHSGVLENLGELRRVAGRLDEAAADYREALRLRRLRLGATHGQTAKGCIDLAEVLLAQGQEEAALALLDEGLTIARRMPEPWRMLITRGEALLATAESGRR